VVLTLLHVSMSQGEQEVGQAVDAALLLARVEEREQAAGAAQPEIARDSEQGTTHALARLQISQEGSQPCVPLGSVALWRGISEMAQDGAGYLVGIGSIHD
jgi:hypothetical protein